MVTIVAVTGKDSRTSPSLDTYPLPQGSILDSDLCWSTFPGRTKYFVWFGHQRRGLDGATLPSSKL
jgi:hypothetical protein